MYEYFFNNGYHIIALTCIFMYFNIIGSIFFFLKAYSLNYYLNFSHLYKDPHIHQWKHMIRLTDSGHIANILVFFNKAFLPLAFNLHFVIMIVYYGSYWLLNMKDLDTIENKNIDTGLMNFHQNINHFVPFFIMVFYLLITEFDKPIFTNETFFYSVMWALCWFLFIALPWKYFTGDSIYSVLSDDTPIFIKIGLICVTISVLFIANYLGNFIQTYKNDIRTYIYNLWSIILKN